MATERSISCGVVKYLWSNTAEAVEFGSKSRGESTATRQRRDKDVTAT